VSQLRLMHCSAECLIPAQKAASIMLRSNSFRLIWLSMQCASLLILRSACRTFTFLSHAVCTCTAPSMTSNNLLPEVRRQVCVADTCSRAWSIFVSSNLAISDIECCNMTFALKDDMLAWYTKSFSLQKSSAHTAHTCCT
jgi:hypothetical protein